MGGGQSHIEAAAPEPVRMPNANDPNIIAAGRRAMLNASRRGGRQSTMLSDVVNRMVNGSQGALGQ